MMVGLIGMLRVIKFFLVTLLTFAEVCGILYFGEVMV